MSAGLRLWWFLVQVAAIGLGIWGGVQLFNWAS